MNTLQGQMALLGVRPWVAMRQATVFGRRRNNSAAPPAPDTLPPVSFSGKPPYRRSTDTIACASFRKPGPTM
jgi:hypothetical protein